MKFEFAKATEVTELAFIVNPEYKKAGYTRVFITPDVKDYHLLRVLPGFDKDYEEYESKIILEVQMIPKSKKDEANINIVSRILEEDDFCNFSCKDYYSMDEIIESVDGGFGILNLEE